VARGTSGFTTTSLADVDWEAGAARTAGRERERIVEVEEHGDAFGGWG